MITAGHTRYNERSKRLVEHSEYDTASFFSSYSLSKALENSPRFSPRSRYDPRNDFVGSFASDSDEKGACVTDESRFFGSRFAVVSLYELFRITFTNVVLLRLEHWHVRRTSFSASSSWTSFIFFQPSSLLLSPLRILRERSSKSSMCRTRDFLSVQDGDDRCIVARKTVAVTYTELVLRRSFRHSSSRTFHTRARSNLIHLAS